MNDIHNFCLGVYREWYVGDENGAYSTACQQLLTFVLSDTQTQEECHDQFSF